MIPLPFQLWLALPPAAAPELADEPVRAVRSSSDKEELFLDSAFSADCAPDCAWNDDGLPWEPSCPKLCTEEFDGWSSVRSYVEYPAPTFVDCELA